MLSQSQHSNGNNRIAQVYPDYLNLAAQQIGGPRAAITSRNSSLAQHSPVPIRSFRKNRYTATSAGANQGNSICKKHNGQCPW